jgi:hypothetical protein
MNSKSRHFKEKLATFEKKISTTYEDYQLDLI